MPNFLAGATSLVGEFAAEPFAHRPQDRAEPGHADLYLLWNVDPATWRERACDIAGRNLTASEVRQYLPNNPDARPTCSRFAD